MYYFLPYAILSIAQSESLSICDESGEKFCGRGPRNAGAAWDVFSRSDFDMQESRIRKLNTGSGAADHMRKGEKRREEVLDCAVQILVETGYSGLSFRKVAEAAGITVGNLQFYFPTRADLIEAMLKREMGRYDTELGQAVDPEAGVDGETTLMQTIDYLLGDQTSQSSCIIFWELWALAAHDVTAANIMNAYYQTYLDTLAALVQRTRPSLTPAKANRCAFLIISLIEGASLFRGYQKPRLPAVRNAEKDIKKLVLKIIDDIDN